MENFYELLFIVVMFEDLIDLFFLSEVQCGFFDVVCDGCIYDVCLYVQEKCVDVNCVNLLGEIVLQLVVNNECYDIVKFFFENGVEVSMILL